MSIEPTESEDQLEEIPEIPENERFGWAAYFGVITGLVLGILTAALTAELLLALWPERDYAKVFWQVASPLLALLGLVFGGFGFHQAFRGQKVLPGMIFVVVLAVSMMLLFRPAAFGWIHRPSEQSQSASVGQDQNASNPPGD